MNTKNQHKKTIKHKKTQKNTHLTIGLNIINLKNKKILKLGFSLYN